MTTSEIEAIDLDPTIPAPMANVADYGFEGRLQDRAYENGYEQAHEWARDARYFEYTKAADPIASGHAPQLPIAQFSPEIYRDQPTGVIPLDLSKDLGITTGEATSPALLANFVRIRAGEQIDTNPNATSQLYYVLYGRGMAALDERAGGPVVAWEKGDFLTLPAGARATFYAEADTAMYWVHDEPLLRHLGVQATEPRFAPTKFHRADAVAELEHIASRPGANAKNRVSVLLANADQEQTLTLTHVLWAMFGVLPPGQEQRPHRHQSVALDLILDAQPGCYTLLGTHLDERGEIADPIRVDWQAGGAFTTPPGMWHAHFNTSDAPAHLIPVQDAGLQTYLRSLDMQFTRQA